MNKLNPTNRLQGTYSPEDVYLAHLRIQYLDPVWQMRTWMMFCITPSSGDVNLWKTPETRGCSGRNACSLRMSSMSGACIRPQSLVQLGTHRQNKYWIFGSNYQVLVPKSLGSGPKDWRRLLTRPHSMHGVHYITLDYSLLTLTTHLYGNEQIIVNPDWNALVE